MAGRLISGTLLRHAAAVTASASASRSIKPTLFPCNCVVLAQSHRHRSSHATKPQLIEIDLSSSSSSSSSSSLSGDEYEVALKMFDDLVQSVLVKKSTPDWLPFVPGSSFWVPPRHSPSSPSVVHLIQKFTDELTDEESLSLATLRGWPSSKFFIQENEAARRGDAGVEVNSPENMEVTVQVKVLKISENNVVHSEDEE